MTAETRQRKAARDLERRRKQQLYLLIAIVAVAVIALGVIVLTTQQLTQSAQQAAQIAESETYAGIERSVTEDGMFALGNPDAPLTIAEYSSFSCGHCLGFHDNQFPQLLEYIRDGSVYFVYVPVAFDQYAAAATVAAYCAGQQDRFWEMHDILFGYFAEFSINGYTRGRFDAAANALGLDQAAFDTCLESSEASNWMSASTDLLRQLAQEYPEVTGTPTLTFNGVPPEWGSGAPPMDFIRQKIAEAAG